MLLSNYEKDLQHYFGTKEPFVRLTHELAHYVLIEKGTDTMPEDYVSLSSHVMDRLEGLEFDDLFVEEIKAICVQFVFEPDLEVYGGANDIEAAFEKEEDEVTDAVLHFKKDEEVILRANQLRRWLFETFGTP